MFYVVAALCVVQLVGWGFALRRLSRSERDRVKAWNRVSAGVERETFLGASVRDARAESARANALLDGLTLLIVSPGVGGGGPGAQYTLRELASLYYHEAGTDRCATVYRASSSHGRISVDIVGPPEPIDPGAARISPPASDGREAARQAQREQHPSAGDDLTPWLAAGGLVAFYSEPEQCGARFPGYVSGDPLGDVCDRDAGHDGPHAVSLYVPPAASADEQRRADERAEAFGDNSSDTAITEHWITIDGGEPCDEEAAS